MVDLLSSTQEAQTTTRVCESDVYAYEGLLPNRAGKLPDVQGADDDVIPSEEDIGYHASPLQLAATQIQHLWKACARTESVRLSQEVGVEDLARREDAVFRLVNTYPLALPTLMPSSKWLGHVVNWVVSINTAMCMLTPRAKQTGLHTLELFGGIGPGVLRTARAAGYTVRCYTYVDWDQTSRQIAHAVFANLPEQYPNQLPTTASRALDERLPRHISALNLETTLDRKFVLHFSSIAFPLNALLKKERSWQWGDTQENAFLQLKEALCSATILRLPDPFSPFILTTDWSQRGMGAILSQVNKEGEAQPICFASRSWDTASVSQDGDMRQVQRWVPHLVFGCAFNESSRRTVDML